MRIYCFILKLVALVFYTCFSTAIVLVIILYKLVGAEALMEILTAYFTLLTGAMWYIYKSHPMPPKTPIHEIIPPKEG